MIVLKIIGFIWFCLTLFWLVEIAPAAIRYRIAKRRWMNQKPSKDSKITEPGHQRVPLVIVPKN